MDVESASGRLWPGVLIRGNMAEKELLFSLTKKDFKVQTFRGSGPGGQHRNKKDTGVRIIHDESGARGEATEERSQEQNKRIAFRRLIDSSKFKIWHIRKCKEIIDKKTLEQKVEESMAPENLKIEVKDSSGRWIEYLEDDVCKHS